MTEEMNEVMVVDNTTTTTSLSPVNVDGAVEFWDNYQELTKALLDESDYQGTQFKKKSAWRKYATAFNLSDEIIKEEEIREPDTDFYRQRDLARGLRQVHFLGPFARLLPDRRGIHDKGA